MATRTLTHQVTHYSRTWAAATVGAATPRASGRVWGSALVAGGRSNQQVGFGEVLRRYRVAAGLTQEALAERAALSPRGISDLERAARTHPYPATVRRLADALGLSEADRYALEAAATPSARFDVGTP